VSNTDDLAELWNAVSDLSISEHLGDSSRLSDFVSDLNDLGSIRMGRSSDTESVVREGSPVSGGGRLGERVVGNSAISSAHSSA
jgi:hypothetical protein